ncbi:hypothetical protein ACFFX0_23295 [Citricoccus parietis]|uniref:Uncharacterized protein n=1 Tax=Citricoccus parietis TaxID=592307 RepID=A0ABV5G4Y8_9MICC
MPCHLCVTPLYGALLNRVASDLPRPQPRVGVRTMRMLIEQGLHLSDQTFVQ